MPNKNILVNLETVEWGLKKVDPLSYIRSRI